MLLLLPLEQHLRSVGSFALCCSVLFCAVLFCSVLFCSVPFCVASPSSRLVGVPSPARTLNFAHSEEGRCQSAKSYMMLIIMYWLAAFAFTHFTFTHRFHCCGDAMRNPPPLLYPGWIVPGANVFGCIAHLCDFTFLCHPLCLSVCLLLVLVFVAL